jgi:tetratricopeptide (TPR) repeat protein
MVLAGGGEIDLAQAKMAEALVLFRQVGDRWGTSQVLNAMGDIARALGDNDRASTLYTESLQLYRQLGVKRDIPASLHNLGHVALARGDNLKAKEFFKESLTLHQELGNKHGITESLVGLAGVAANQEPVRAARLLGSSAALREALGRSMWPVEQLAFEHNLSVIKAQLDDATWQAAWNEGQAMSMERAIRFALEGEGGGVERDEPEVSNHK